MKDSRDGRSAASGAGCESHHFMAINPRGFHRVAYREWPCYDDPSALVCVHGVTRHSADFFPLAETLKGRRRLVCPDLVGRGQSDWLADPADYHVPQFNCDMATLIARLQCDSIDFLGTSLGGLCGIVMAGLPNSPIRRLIVNDVAPEIPIRALRRINAYLRADLSFPDLEAVEAHLRECYAGFSPMSDSDWREMAETSVRPGTDDTLTLHFDPQIGLNFRNYWLTHHFKLWKFWDRITCPILILGGSESDFLTPALLERMKSTQPEAEVVIFEGAGHTPTLRSGEQLAPLLEWLGA
ncbi:MAG: alpha/beta fold hydrolase [Pseudomonadota bacterium]